MVVKYELKKGAKMTPEQMQEVEKAAQMPIVYDEDSPELTEEMARAFSEARVKKPYRGKKLYFTSPLIHLKRQTRGMEKIILWHWEIFWRKHYRDKFSTASLSVMVAAALPEGDAAAFYILRTMPKQNVNKSPVE